MKLTETQQKVLDKMEDGKEYSFYDLQCRLNTLTAMSKKGVIKNCTGSRLGTIFSPHTAFKYRKI